VRVLGPPNTEHRTGVVSFTIDALEPNDIAAILEEHYGILARAGLQCAPLAHQAMGTTEGGGTVRLSVGPFLTEDDVRYVVASVTEIARDARPSASETTLASCSPTATVTPT
jgi:selenocysteine lyase/cysteine desulfurase